MKQVTRLILLLAMLLAVTPAWAAGRKVTGTVKDKAGEPLVGASVMLSGSRTGCMADMDGNFSIQVPDGAVTLKVALVGYKGETIKVAPSQSVVNIVMTEDSQTLEETIVVGYGTQKKVNLTGAVAAVEGKALENRPVSNISTLLQGSVSGLNVSTSSGMPGSTASLNIRGTTSINGASPLILVDGSIGDINAVDPNDVASISVIKDASAAAVYGARAAFGVILVTTKKGEESNGKATVRYNGRFGWVSPTTSTDYESRGYWHLKVVDDFSQQSTHAPYFSKTYWDDEDWMELLLRVNDKTENPDRPWVVTKEVNGKNIWKYYANTDWYHEMFQDNRFATQQNVSLSGGSNGMHYFVSGGYRHDDGMARLNTDMFNSYNMRSKIDFSINKYATFENNTSIFGSKYTYQGDGAMENTIAYANQGGISVFPTHNPDGTYIYDNIYSSYKPTNGRYIVQAEGKHPGTKLKTDFTTMSRLNIMPIKQLTITGDFTYRFLQNRNMTRSNNIAFRKEGPDAPLSYYTSGMGQDDLQEQIATYNYYSANALATYKDSFNDVHNITAVAGYNWEYRHYKNLTAYVMNLGSPELNDVSLAPSLDGAKVTGGQNEYSLQGVFGRVNYDYAGKYLLELSGRYDGTSRFAKGHRWGMFPSGSVGWRFSEEKFFEGLNPTWTNGKVRFSYGTLGNQNVSSYYTYLRTVSIANSTMLFDNSSFARQSTVADPVASDMTWETAHQYDLGFDLGFFNNRLNITTDLYIRDTKNMLTAGDDLPAVYGAGVPEMNAVDLRTKGYELSVDWNDSFELAGHKFTYNLGGNLSDYRSHITRVKYDDGKPIDEKLLSQYYVGREFGVIWGYKTDGFFKTREEAQEYASKVDLSYVNKRVEGGWQAGDLKFVDTNGDGVIGYGKNTVADHGDKVALGNSGLRLQYGFRGGFSYCGFDANVFFQGTGNHYWYPHAASGAFWGPYSSYYQISFMERDFQNKYWTEDNQNAYFPRPMIYSAGSGYLQYTNDRYIQNLRYLRLKNLTIGYTLPKKLTQKAMIEKVRVYFSGENLCYWSPLTKNTKYIDPESCIDRDNSAFWNMIAYPWPKTFMFGLDVQF